MFISTYVIQKTNVFLYDRADTDLNAYYMKKTDAYLRRPSSPLVGQNVLGRPY